MNIQYLITDTRALEYCRTCNGSNLSKFLKRASEACENLKVAMRKGLLGGFRNLIDNVLQTQDI